MKKLTKLHIDITGDCNLRCKYCSVTFHENGRGETRPVLDTDRVISIIEQAKEQGISNFSISGGEPLVHHGIMRILSSLNPNCKVTLFTNLHEPDVDMLEEIAQMKCVKEIIVSLDGFDGHNKARCPSRHEDVLKHLETFRKISPSCYVTINTVITKYNIGEIPRLHQYLSDLGINHWRIDMPMRSISHDVYCEFEKAIIVASGIIRARYASLSLQQMRLSIFRIYKSDLEGMKIEDVENLLLGDAHPCEYNLGKMTIDARGNLSLCSPLKLNMGNINDEEISFGETARGYSGHEFFKLTQDSIDYCQKCRYYKLCGTGCRADALEWTGNVTGPDPLSCSVMPLIEYHVIPILSNHMREVYLGMIKVGAERPKYTFSSQRDILTLKGGDATC